ncbi:hypothetical protein QE401_003998 [Pseudoroseomonas cervicalis]|nr:hypothetical protein [Pseudoroseomonas cervicalis]
MPMRLPPSWRLAHLAQQVQQEQQGAVGDARQAGAEAAGMAELLGLLAHLLLHLLPLHAKGRVGQHVVELLSGMPVLGQGVAGHDVADILALDQHVRLADGVALVVQLLAEHAQRGLRVVRHQMLPRHREHAARPGRGVVDGAHGAGAGGQDVAVLDEQQVDHQPDDVARGEVLARRLVGDFREFADQLLEGQAHIVVADLVGVQREGGEALGHLVEQPGLAQPVGLLGEAEALEDVADGRREAADIGVQIGAEIVLVAHQGLQVEGRGVGEGHARDAPQEGLGLDPHGRLGLRLGEHLFLGGRQHAVEAAQHREGQDDPAVFGGLVVAAKQVSHGPDEGGEGLRLAHLNRLIWIIGHYAAAGRSGSTPPPPALPACRRWAGYRGARCRRGAPFACRAAISACGPS